MQHAPFHGWNVTCSPSLAAVPWKASLLRTCSSPLTANHATAKMFDVSAYQPKGNARQQETFLNAESLEHIIAGLGPDCLRLRQEYRGLTRLKRSFTLFNQFYQQHSPQPTHQGIS